MTDREMLEMAAKAAELQVVWYEPDDDSGEPWCFIPDCHPPHNRRQRDKWSGTVWNPLVSDGDALRLAVKLGLFISHSAYKPGENAYGFVRISWYGQRVEFESEKFTDDPYAATRRAIVRAAAEIGRNMT